MNDRLDWLQSLRGIAALMVLFFHMAPYWAPVPGLQSASGWMKSGFSGVDVFFVISGFVVYRAGSRSVPDRGLFKFLRKRAARIYLTYWPTFLLVTAISVGCLGTYPKSWEQVFFSFFLLYPKVWDNWIGVAWSLTYELYFYGVLGCLLLLPARWHARCLAVLIAGVALWNLGLIRFAPEKIFTDTQPLRFVLGGFIVEFLAGALVAIGFETRPGWFKPVRLILPLGTALIAAGFWIGGSSVYFSQVEIMRAGSYGLVALGSLLIALSLEHTRHRPHRWLVAIGDFSFSLYLVHFAMLAFLGGVRSHLLADHPATWLPYSLLMPVAVLSASYIWYLAVEARTVRWINDRL